jgi:hypothetical protein
MTQKIRLTSMSKIPDLLLQSSSLAPSPHSAQLALPPKRSGLLAALSVAILLISICQPRIFAQTPDPSSAQSNAPAPPAQATAPAPPAQSMAPAAAAQTMPPVPPPAPPNQEDQTKRIFGVVPNFTAVYTTTILPRQTVKDKFMDATEDSFDYSAIFVPAVLAGYLMETNATPEFHQGAAGYARYFWHSAVDQTSENYFVEFFVPIVTHEDTRYYTLGHGGFFRRTGYALSRAVVTRSDASKEVFNVSEVLGAGASAGLSSAYYPSSQRSLPSVSKAWGIDIAVDSVSFVLKEFWPDINHRMFGGARPQSDSH